MASERTSFSAASPAPTIQPRTHLPAATATLRATTLATLAIDSFASIAAALHSTAHASTVSPAISAAPACAAS